MPLLRVPRYIAVGRFCFRGGGCATTGESSPRLLSAILRLCNPVSFGRDPATSANQWKLKQQPMNYALSTQPGKFPFSRIYDSFSIIAKRALSTTKRRRILNALSVPRRNMIFRYSDTFDSCDSVTPAIIYANDSKNKQS